MLLSLNRFFKPLAAFFAFLSILTVSLAYAENEVTVKGGSSFKPVTIAVTSFQGEGDVGNKLTQVINNNFKRSVFLLPVDAAGAVANPDVAPFILFKYSTRFFKAF